MRKFSITFLIARLLSVCHVALDIAAVYNNFNASSMARYGPESNKKNKFHFTDFNGQVTFLKFCRPTFFSHGWEILTLFISQNCYFILNWSVSYRDIKG